MISLYLNLTPTSAISLDELGAIGLTDMLGELDLSGYQSAPVDSPVPPQDGERQYHLAPGPATLRTIDRPQSDSGPAIEFHLEGATFERRTDTAQSYAVLWMRLVRLGVRLFEAHAINFRLVDSQYPDAVAEQRQRNTAEWPAQP